MRSLSEAKVQLPRPAAVPVACKGSAATSVLFTRLYKRYKPTTPSASNRRFGLHAGGFGGAEAELLAKHRPELASWPTVSADHCTGDGLKLGAFVSIASRS